MFMKDFRKANKMPLLKAISVLITKPNKLMKKGTAAIKMLSLGIKYRKGINFFCSSKYLKLFRKSYF